MRKQVDYILKFIFLNQPIYEVNLKTNDKVNFIADSLQLLGSLEPILTGDHELVKLAMRNFETCFLCAVL